MENRDSCVFYASWLDAIEAMPDNVRGEALMAILVYALRGETTEKQGAMTKVIMAMVKPQIEANNKRYENGCKGGRPKVEKNQNETKPKPKRNQNETKKNQTVTYNDNVNDNVNDNESESITPTHPLAQNFKSFNDYIRQQGYPMALDFKEPLTIEEFARLYKFGWQKMARCAAELHNKEAALNYRNAFTTWWKFIEKIK